ncbi:hypothetical protein C8R46DRAFT_1355706 [Mycena filopes]|nr:hypothetical protein C8R46DRAFT_1355706 [Mycena filopes]
MATLPQELVDAIIHEIDDVPTLKACCLAGFMFRRTSQRMLWRSFTLSTRNSGTFPDLSALLDESPHIAGYIHTLNANFARFEPEQTQSFLEILSKLEHLHSCTISYIFSAHRFAESHPEFLSTFYDFLARQPLCELRVNSTGLLSSDVFLRLLTMAPVISWRDIQVAEEETPQRQPHLPKLRDLTLGINTKGIDEMLAQPELREYTRHLLRLTLNRDPSCKLIFTAASTLKHIGFNILGTTHSDTQDAHLPPVQGPTSQATVPIPLLPALSSVEFTFSFRMLTKYSGLILTILDHSPVLASITVTFTFTSARVNPDEFADWCGTGMTAVDTALAVHATRPSIRYRLRVNPVDLDGNPFVALIKASMPQAYGSGRLALEASCREQFFVDNYFG